MVELTPKERLQPSLLDRLTDDEPEKSQESRQQRVLSMAKLRQCVLRDLAWLFNAVNLSTMQSLDDYPLVRQSVLNYGLPDMAGHTVSSIDVTELENLLQHAILNFEPRILRNTLKVRTSIAAEKMNLNAITFYIEGELWGQPLPEQLYLRTDIDLDNGEVNITEQRTR